MKNHSIAPSPAAGSCGCGREHASSPARTPTVIRLGAALLLAVGAAAAPLPEIWKWTGYGAAYLLAGGAILWNALLGLWRRQWFDENFLMSIASLGAFAVGEAAEAVAVMIFYGVGELLQDSAVGRSRNHIEQLMDLRSDHASVRRNGTVVTVAPGQVAVGECIVVHPGERIPLDGRVESGTAFLDTRALTGETAPRRVAPGSEALSGSINTDGLLELRVIRPFAASTVSRILELVRNAADKKSPTEQFITRFARVYTPAVVAIALPIALLPPLAGYGTFAEWFYNALNFLIISCPCALVLSIPLSFFGGIGGAARNGILVRSGGALDRLARLDAVAFDKTGTLTRGVFRVVARHPAAGVSEAALLRAAAVAEQHARHPIARAVREAGGDVPPEAGEFRELPGLGVEFRSAAGLLRAGSAELMRRSGIDGLPATAQTAVHVARDNRYLGCLLISDEPKPAVRDALDALRRAGVRRLEMLTGDSAGIAAAVAAELGIDRFRAELLPQDKVAELERLMAAVPPGRTTAFVGDGINDAPVLARADLGIAMGGLGSDAAIEAADVVLMHDHPGSIAVAVGIARRTVRVVRENIALALGVKGAVMLLALAGHASVWFAICADVGVALLAVLNAVRPLNYRPPEVRNQNRQIGQTVPSASATASSIR